MAKASPRTGAAPARRVARGRKPDTGEGATVAAASATGGADAVADPASASRDARDVTESTNNGAGAGSAGGDVAIAEASAGPTIKSTRVKTRSAPKKVAVKRNTPSTVSASAPKRRKVRTDHVDEPSSAESPAGGASDADYPDASDPSPESVNGEFCQGEGVNTLDGMISHPEDEATAGPGSAAEDRSGVVFCSRIPPFMSLSKLRSYFSKYGKVGKIYAEPESITDYKKRVKMGGNKKLKFVHGWLEFLDKSVAKQVAAHLNGQPVGEKKRHNFWRDDLWNLMYLPRYKFSDVMDYLRQHKNERKEKLSFHLANSRKANYNYVEQLEAEKHHQRVEKKLREKGLPAYKHVARLAPREKKPEKEAEQPPAVPLALLGAITS